MVDGIFKRLSPITVEALHNNEIKSVDVDELFAALSSIKSDIEITHLSLATLHEEANYVHARLKHMEDSMLAKAKTKASHKNSDDGSTDSGSVGGAGVAKVLDMGTGDARFDTKMTKIQEAKNLTADLLQSIEKIFKNDKIAESEKASTPAHQLA